MTIGERINERLHEWVDEVDETIDEQYREALLTEARGRVKRHGLGSRISHWLLVVLWTVLMATGVMIWTGWYGPLADQVWGGYYKAFGAHMWAGILILAVGFVLFPFYHIYVDGHNPVPDMDDIEEAIAIAVAFVGLRRYITGYHRARRTWDEKREEWAAYHPMQKGFFWIQLGLLAILAVTGFEMYDRMAADPPAWIGWLGAPAAWLAWEHLKQLHLLFAFVFAAAVLLHMYFPLMPGNWDVLTAMITGEMDAYVITDDGDGGDDDAVVATDGGPETGGEEVDADA